MKVLEMSREEMLGWGAPQGARMTTLLLLTLFPPTRRIHWSFTRHELAQHSRTLLNLVWALDDKIIFQNERAETVQ